MSKVVFVGNVPYKISEDALIEVFKSVGQVVAFRLVFDRDTGKPKGYGFCEFADHATALSAVRNLNNTEVGGRSLRIDLAESDPLLQGKTTKGGEIIEPEGANWRANGDDQEGVDILSAIPTGKPLLPGQRAEETIRRFMQERNSAELGEILAQMKAFAFTHPKQALVLLQQHPQVAFGIFRGLAISGTIPPDLVQELTDTTNGRGLAPPSAYPSGPGQFPPPGPPPSFNSYPPARPPSQPPLPPMYSHPGMQPTPPPPPPMPGYGPGPMPPPYYGRPMSGPPVPAPPPPHIPQNYGQPPPPQPPQQGTGLLASLQNGGNAEQQHALSVLMSLTPAQLAGLSAQDRATIEQLRNGMIR